MRQNTPSAIQTYELRKEAILADTAFPWDVVFRFIAVVGALTGPAAFVLSVLNYNRDKPKIKIRLEWNHVSVGVFVTNVGRRPIHISKVYVEDKSGHKAELGDNVAFRLDEGDGERCAWAPFIESLLNVDQALRATVVDASGRRYRTRWVHRKQQKS